jgi:hypothetical protein
MYYKHKLKWIYMRVLTYICEAMWKDGWLRPELAAKPIFEATLLLRRSQRAGNDGEKHGVKSSRNGEE